MTDRRGGQSPGAPNDVLVVTGAGGMGQAIARRIGSGKTVLIADVESDAVDAVGASVRRDGYHVITATVDVSRADEVRRLAETARELGCVRYLAHTAGVSPARAVAAAVVDVDLVGVALMVEEFGKVIDPGGAAVVVASMAGYLAPGIPPEDERRLARAPAEELLELDCVRAIRSGDSGLAYAFAKRANLLRVQAASVEWGRCGARVNSISPGIIATPMGHAELASPAGELMRSMIAHSGSQRLGTADDIAAAVEFLLGPNASFVTGTDLRVDGGVVGSLMAGLGPSGER